MIRLKAKAAILAAAVILGSGPTASAAEDPLAGRSIDLIVSARAGSGGFDTIARLFARYMETAIGGGTRVTVRDMPEAAGLLAARTIYEAAPDGTTIGMLQTSLLLTQILGEEGVAYDLGRMSWIGKLSEETRVLVSGPGSGIATVDDLLAATGPVNVAVSTNTAAQSYDLLLTNAVIGSRLTPVAGFKSEEKGIAVLRGDVPLTSGGYATLDALLANPGTAVVLRMSSGALPAPWDGVPSLADLATTERSRRAQGVIDAIAELGRWLMAPPGVPPAELASLRRAFGVVVADPGFLDEAQRYGFDIVPMDGETLAGRVAALMADGSTLAGDVRAAIACGQARAEGQDSPDC